MSKNQTGKLPEGAHELANRIVQLKHDAMVMGLIKTGHALEEATQAVGWEMAEILEGKRADHKLRSEDAKRSDN